MSELSAESFVRQGLRSLEADLRELALLALADWEQLGLVSPELFRAVASLQRPSWGHWNGLLTALREARKTILRVGTAEQRERVRRAAVLNEILDGFDCEADPSLAEALRPLAQLLRVRLARKPRVNQLVTLPITLRNEVAHFQPDDAAWWQRAAEGLRPLLEWKAAGGLRPIAATAEAFRAPWFLDGAAAALNGFNDAAVLYAAATGPAVESAEMVRPLLAAVRRLLGQEQAQEESLKRLLARLVPEELKGVLLGDYLVRGPAVGSGGFADVFAGVQVSTGRKVAVKVLHDGLDADARARFQQEAVFLSQFNHPHIVRVLGRGEEPWFPPRDPAVAQGLAAEPWFQELAAARPTRSYLVLEWVAGHTLEDVFQGRRQPRPDGREVTRWFAQAAAALAAVHGAGLVHRDVKPGNLMVTEDGTVRLMDFGIARSQDDRRTIQTTPGRILGTPAYLAPEQLETRAAEAEVGPSSDLYALCATFYELYTRRRLFGHDAETEQAVNTRKLQSPHPERPRQLVRDLAWEIDTILLGGLRREASERYRSAGDLERDLQHVLREEPIEYRRPSAARRLRLWWRRNPVVARLTAAVALLLVSLAGGALVAALLLNGSWQQESAARGLAEERADDNRVLAGLEKVAKEKAERKERESTERLVRFLVGSGWQAFDRGDTLEAVPLFVQAFREDVRNAAAEPVHRLRLAAVLRRCPRLVHIAFHDGPVSRVALSTDGRLALMAGGGTARVWEVATGRPLGKPVRQPGGIGGGCFSPDARRFLTWSHSFGKGGGARLWDTATGEPAGPVLRAGYPIAQGAFSPDGRLVTLRGEAPERHLGAVVHDAATGAPATLPGAGQGPWRRVLFASQAGKVVTVRDAPKGQVVRAWELKTGSPVGPPLEAGIELQVVVSADGRRALTVPSYAPAQVWDLESGRRVGLPLRHGRKIVGVAIDADGEHVATVSEPELSPNGTRPLKSGEAQVWEAETGRPVGAAFRNGDDVLSVFFTGNGDRLVTVGKAAARVWDVASGLPVTPPLRHRQGLTSAAASADGRLVATAGLDGSARVWDLAVSDQVGAIQPEGPIESQLAHFTADRAVAFGPDGRALLVVSFHKARVWNAQTGRPITPPLGGTAAVARACFSPDGRLVATAGSLQVNLTHVGTAQVWDARRGTAITGLLQHARGPNSAPGYNEVTAVAFSPDGTRLVTAGFDRTVRFWDVRTGKPAAALLRHRFPVRAIAFSDDGRRLLTVAYEEGKGGEARVWDAATGAAVGPPQEHPTGVRLAALSPDGRQVLLGAGRFYGPGGDVRGAGGVAEIRDAVTDKLMGQSLPQPGSLAALAFSPNGRRVLTACTNGTARVWDASTGTPVTPPLVHPVEISQAFFSRDGRLVVCVYGATFMGRGGEARLWDAATGELVVPALRHLLAVRSAALSPDQRRLATGGQDLVALWDLAPERRFGDDLALLARLLGESEITPDGHVTALAAEPYRRAWEEYDRRWPAPRRAPTPAQVLAWHTREALRAEAAGRWRTAGQHLDALLTSAGADGPLHARRGLAHFRQEKWGDAARSFTRALELGVDDTRVRYHRGLALAELERWDEAIHDYDRLLQDGSTDWQVFFQRGRAQFESGRNARAVRDCTEAIAALGGKYRGLGDFAAEQQARIELLNGKWGPWNVRAMAHQNLGHWKEAAADYGCVLEGNPKHLWALCNRGTCRRMLGEWGPAEADFGGAIRGGLNSWRPWAGRAWVAAARGRWEAARSDYAQALRHNPTNVEVWYEAALARVQAEDRAGYQSLCGQLLRRVAGANLGTRLRAAWTCALAPDAVKDWAELRRWCEEAKAKNLPTADLVLGAVCFRAGHLEEALAALTKVSPRPARQGTTRQLLLALALHQTGQEEAAAAELGRAVRSLEAAQAGSGWTDRLVLELLRREAETVCGKKARKSPSP